MQYKEAKKIREKSFGSMLAEQEGGLGQALKATISKKTQAKMTGMKESFDPMNIAKFVTGGSNWAPAMLGKLTGRKQSSIDYFSGVRRKGKGTAEKLGPVGGGGGGDVLGILQSIESLLHTTREEDKLKSEEEKNFAEEKALEKAKRHKEFMEALTGKPYKQKTPTSATKVDDQAAPTPGLSLLELLGGASALSTLGKVLGFFAGGLGLALLSGVGLAGILLKLLNDDPNAEETNKGIQNAGQTDGGLGAAIQEVRSDEVASRKAVVLREAHKKGIIKSSWWQFDKQGKEEKEYLKSIGFDDKTGLIQKDRDNGFNAVDEDGNPYLSKTRAKEVGATTSEVPSQANKSNSETNSGTATTPTPAATSTTVPSAETAQPNVTSAVPVQTEPAATQALNQVQKENLELGLPVNKKDPSTVSINKSANISTNGKPLGQIPFVRNAEETIQRMIYDNTRVV
jgi:hypothetical protein